LDPTARDIRSKWFRMPSQPGTEGGRMNFSFLMDEIHLKHQVRCAKERCNIWADRPLSHD
jgi:hypothetical protein